MLAYFEKIAKELSIRTNQVANTAELLTGGATVPFIARYRKEYTDSLDEQAIMHIRDRMEQLEALGKRRDSIMQSIDEQGKLSDELKMKLEKAESLSELEDIYLPYRPKRKTRATMAKAKGLEPLAKMLMSQNPGSVAELADRFIDAEKEVNSTDDALAGARDIIAEWVNEHQYARSRMRRLFRKSALLTSKVIKGKAEEGMNFKTWFDFSERISSAPSHRVLAMFRGETKKILTLTIRPPQEEALRILTSLHAPSNLWQEELKGAAEDSYKRLLCPSLENDLRKELKQKADAEAIEIFGGNLRQLLLAPPLGQKSVLALDPGYRTGAKLVCLDRQGKLLDTTTIYPTHNTRQQSLAEEILRDKIDTHRIEAISIGNGTAGRETEAFVRSMELDSNIIITMVNEDGASIYSASEAARLEFPDRDITVRGAVSIGRRLQDPLAELVKIDPKSIGVGQYQHDVDQHRLKSKLQSVVESCVNGVGVELNSASAELLAFVSGLGRTLADNILEYRNSNGPFKTRRELLKVPRLGPKAYEQCAGFLRIRNGSNPLDNSAVHPERYKLIQQMAKDAAVSLPAFLQSEETRKDIKLEEYIDASVGIPTLLDIMKELNKPGRDPRDTFKQFCFADNILTIDDIREGMLLPAIITNVTKFGAFADLGIKQDGLIHISQMADRFIKDPGEVVRVRQQVEVRVLKVDPQRKRIALSLRKE